MKKFLIGFGGFLILLGAGGLINHISMTFKAAEAEREMYGGSIDFMLLQMVGSFGPYLFALIGGGIIIAIVAFLTAYEKRNDLTSQLIHTLSNKDSDEKINVISPQPQQTENTPPQDSKEDEIPHYEQPQNERLYWNG
ncbi:hypothetical protein [Metabacillus halosaccharovorans]|uniref:hypothetical protein n=1 Tax=Metabacillus halosaccharovorans TaxID=930124 RepID=UPI001C1FC988|nr:hypothetical protein [Metabacillus halosaccharovorans]MBU7594680.1 YigZ family protein [Metabacillus halosaccharovorans]